MAPSIVMLNLFQHPWTGVRGRELAPWTLKQVQGDGKVQEGFARLWHAERASNPDTAQNQTGARSMTEPLFELVGPACAGTP